MKKKFISNIARPWDPTGQFFAAPFYSSDENATSFKQWALPLIFSTFPRSAFYVWWQYYCGRAIEWAGRRSGCYTIREALFNMRACKWGINGYVWGRDPYTHIWARVRARDGEKSMCVAYEISSIWDCCFAHCDVNHWPSCSIKVVRVGIFERLGNSILEGIWILLYYIYYEFRTWP